MGDHVTIPPVSSPLWQSNKAQWSIKDAAYLQRGSLDSVPHASSCGSRVSSDATWREGNLRIPRRCPAQAPMANDGERCTGGKRPKAKLPGSQFAKKESHPEI
jgi:hypothetical protein